MKLKRVMVKDGTWIQANGRSVSGDLGPGEVIGPWVRVTVYKDVADGPSIPVDVLIWGENIRPSEIETKEVSQPEIDYGPDPITDILGEK